MDARHLISASNGVARESRTGALAELQRRLNTATTIGELLARGCTEAGPFCGFARGVILAVHEGRLTSTGTESIDDPACDALRRRTLANPIPLLPGSEEAELIRRAEGFRRRRSTERGMLEDALGLDHYAVAALAPESRAVALIVVDRPEPPVTDADRSTVELFSHLLGLALERVVLRLRMRELSSEIRHLSTSAQALMREAMEAPIALTTDYGHGQVFPAAGLHLTAPTELEALLSDREREVAALIVTGRSNREIGEELHLSPDTVKAHVGRLVRKLGAANRVEAAARYAALSQTPPA